LVFSSSNLTVPRVVEVEVTSKLPICIEVLGSPEIVQSSPLLVTVTDVSVNDT